MAWTSPANAATSEATHALEIKTIAAQLEAPAKFLMLAENEESRIVGYVHTVVRRKVGHAPTGFIRALALHPQQSPNLAHRLLSAALNFLSDSQAVEIKVQAAGEDARLRTMLKHADFQVTSVEITFKNTKRNLPSKMRQRLFEFTEKVSRNQKPRLCSKRFLEYRIHAEWRQHTAARQFQS